MRNAKNTHIPIQRYWNFLLRIRAIVNLSNFQVSLNFGAFFFDFRISAQALKFCQYEYELFGPMEYYAYTLPGVWGYYWTWW